MAVEIPRLQRIQGSDGIPSAGRINVQARNSAADISGRTRALASLGNEMGEIYQEAENDKIKNLSYKSEQDYAKWSAGELQRLKSYEGDPTQAYADFEIEAQKKREEILGSTSGMSDRVQRHVRSNFDRNVASQEIQVMKQRGAQQEAYDNNLFESTVALKRNNLAINAGYIRKDDQGSFLPFDNNIADIKTTVTKRAIDKGLAQVLPEDAKEWSHIYENEDGKMVKVNLSDITKQRVAQELSSGVSASINSMLAAGYKEEAKAAYDRYNGYIDPKTQLTLSNKFKTADVKDSAYKEISKLRGKSEDDQLKYINNIQDSELRSEVLKIKDTDDNRLQNLRTRKENANYNTLATRVMERMNSNNPYYGMADLESDPIYREVWDNMSVKGKKAVMEMVQQPKETNPASEMRVQNLFFGLDTENQVETVTPEKFAEMLTGLNSSDRKKYMGMYERLRTQSEGEQRAMYKQAGDMLRNQLLIDEHIVRDKFGKISGKDEITLLKAQNNLIDHLSSQYGSFNSKQLKDFVTEFSAAEIKRKTFVPRDRRPVTTTTARINGQANSELSPLEGLNRTQVVRFMRQYQAAAGLDEAPPTTNEAFLEYVRTQRK